MCSNFRCLALGFLFLYFTGSKIYGYSQQPGQKTTGIQQPVPHIPNNQFSKIIIADGLDDPWTIIYGPDDHLWLTDGTGKDPEWHSLAPSGINFYNSNIIPGWKNSLLVTSLKQAN